MTEEQKKMEIWDKVSKPPKTALKTIQAGRTKGMTDISPQWRYEAMTRTFGPCGIGWKFSIEKLWTEEASAGQMFVFAQIILNYKIGDVWSEPIQGVGGSMLITAERSGLHSSDEGYKMAITDALGTAMKMIGVAAAIYAGKWDGSKYRDTEPEKTKPKKAKKPTLTTQNTKALNVIAEILKPQIPKGSEWNIDKLASLFLNSKYKAYPSNPERAKEAADFIKLSHEPKEWTTDIPKPADKEMFEQVLFDFDTMRQKYLHDNPSKVFDVGKLMVALRVANGGKLPETYKKATELAENIKAADVAVDLTEGE